jgi:hypothetical protein
MQHVHGAVLTPPQTGEKKIKPVAVPVGFKVVNGSRRIGKQQAGSVLNRIIPKRQRSSARTLPCRNARAGMRACGTQPELEKHQPASAAAFAETLAEAFAARSTRSNPRSSPHRKTEASCGQAGGRSRRGQYERSPPVACSVSQMADVMRVPVARKTIQDKTTC